MTSAPAPAQAPAKTGGPKFGVLTAGLVLAMAMVWVFAQNFGAKGMNAGAPAPDFNLPLLDGSGELSVSEFKGKQPVVLNFWATWCVPCMEEHPWFLQAAELYGDRVQFIGVLYGDDVRKAELFLLRNGSAFPHVNDLNSVASMLYGVTGVPETAFIDKNGTLVHYEPGVVSWDLLQTTIEQMLED
jgi:cytochrome c biogenesis protein CcmG/thiol:disulfide interchange protein DsbE